MLSTEELLKPRWKAEESSQIEIWKSIPNFEHYEISNKGRVRKISYLRINKHSAGYSQIQVFETDGCGQKILGRGKQIGKKILLHRILAEMFIPNPDNKPCVNHKDGNKSNCSLDNLEWCTYSENLKHAYNTGLTMGSKGKGKIQKQSLKHSCATREEYEQYLSQQTNK